VETKGGGSISNRSGNTPRVLSKPFHASERKNKENFVGGDGGRRPLREGGIAFMGHIDIELSGKRVSRLKKMGGWA